MILQDRIERYVIDRTDLINTFWLGYEYEKINHLSSAIHFYLECAEYSDDIDIAYECLIRISECFKNQGERKFHVISNLQWAIDLCPDRPEAYLLMSRAFEASSDWKSSLMFAKIGTTCKRFINLLVSISFKMYELDFQVAHTSWYVGRPKESLRLFRKMKDIAQMNDYYTNIVDINIKKIS